MRAAPDRRPTKISSPATRPLTCGAETWLAGMAYTLLVRTVRGEEELLAIEHSRNREKRPATAVRWCHGERSVDTLLPGHLRVAARARCLQLHK
jgi:hypothetical protein